MSLTEMFLSGLITRELPEDNQTRTYEGELRRKLHSPPPPRTTLCSLIVELRCPYHTYKNGLTPQPFPTTAPRSRVFLPDLRRGIESGTPLLKMKRASLSYKV
jgi:hypothetical protein